MKYIVKILIVGGILGSFAFPYAEATDYVDTLSNSEKNLNSDIRNTGGSQGTANDHLSDIKNGDDRFFNIGNSGEKGIATTLIKVARDLKNIFFVIATIYFLVIIFKLVFANNSQEEFDKFKKGFLWITVGIIVMQISYSFVFMSFNQSVGAGLADNLIKNLFEPLILLLETAASFFFVAVALYAFFRMITANGDEEKAKTGKTTIFYALIGFIVIKIARWIVTAVYSETLCSLDGVTCTNPQTLEAGAGIIFQIINWANSFVGLVVVIMIIYAGALILFSGGDDEKIKKAKSTMIYVFIGILVLVMNYLILTFFILP